MKKGIVFPAVGERREVELPDNVELFAICKELGFEWAEIVRPVGLRGKYCMIVDEEGLLKPNDLNRVATHLYRCGEPIVGNIMIIKEVMGPEGPELAGLDDTDIIRVMSMIPKSMGGNG